MDNNNAYGLYGYPLGHTLAPFIHSELCRVKGVECDYKIFELPPECPKDNFEILKQHVYLFVVLIASFHSFYNQYNYNYTYCNMSFNGS